MAGVRDKDLLRWFGFRGGLNNRTKPEHGPVDENGSPTDLLEAVNVSLRPDGKPQRRPGRTRRVTGASHSLFAAPNGTHLLAYVDGELRAYRQGQDGSLTLDATLTTVADRFIGYMSDDFDVYWANGVDQGRIDEDLQARSFWLDTPDPVVLSATTGALAAGVYEVSVTVADASSRESGASGSVPIRLNAGQGINIALPAKPLDAARWHVYVTAPDGEVFYENATLPIAANSASILNRTPGAKLKTMWLSPLIPCTHLRHAHNRGYGLSHNLAVWSEPYRIGLMAPDNHAGLGTEATLLEPVGDADMAGCWVADHKRTYWMAGPDPANWRQVAKYPHAAVPGTSLTIPGTYVGLETTEEVAYWMARNGTPCLGLPGGVLQPIREQSLALPVDAERGATGTMLFDGIRQLLTTTFGASKNLAAASDSADATVTRRDHRAT